MINVVPLQLEHLNIIKKRLETDGLETTFFIRANQKTLNRFPSFSITADGIYILCGGMILLWPNTGEVWAVISPRAKSYKFAMNEIVNNFILGTVRAFNLTRVQATIDANDIRAIRWIETLHFLPEGILYKYFNDHDYIMYSRVFGE